MLLLEAAPEAPHPHPVEGSRDRESLLISNRRFYLSFRGHRKIRQVARNLMKPWLRRTPHRKMCATDLYRPNGQFCETRFPCE